LRALQKLERELRAGAVKADREAISDRRP